MTIARPYSWYVCVSYAQRQKPFPDSCVCDICVLKYRTEDIFEKEFTMIIPTKRINHMLEYEIKLTLGEEAAYAFLGKWPVGAYRSGDKWYRMRTIGDLVQSGKLDLTGEFVEIPLDTPLRIKGKRCDKIIKFCPMVKDENNNYVFMHGSSPSEIRARFMHMYPACEP